MGVANASWAWLKGRRPRPSRPVFTMEGAWLKRGKGRGSQGNRRGVAKGGVARKGRVAPLPARSCGSAMGQRGGGGRPHGKDGTGGGPRVGGGGGPLGSGSPKLPTPPPPPNLWGCWVWDPRLWGLTDLGGQIRPPLMGLLAPGLPLMGSVQCGDPRLGETSPLCPIAVPLAPHDCPIAVPTVPHSCPQRAPWMPHSCPIADAIVPHSCPPPPTPRAEEDRGGGGAFKAPSLPGPRAQWGCVGCGHGGQR